MNIDLSVDNRAVLAALRAAPQQIAKAERSAINKTGRAVRKNQYLPGMAAPTGLPKRQVQRAVEFKAAGQRRSVGIVQVSGRRIPVKLWTWRVVPVDQTRGYVQVKNDLNGAWITVWAIANPAGNRLPFARWGDEVLGGGLGTSPRRVFGQYTEQLINRQEVSEQLRDEFFAAIERELLK